MGSPSFFIVGAPKAGTTSLNDYLAQYPDIYVPEAKEMHFFGRDLMQKRRKNAKLSTEDYLSHFAGMSGEAIAGESSVLYLKSETSAREIHDFCPVARIIVMLRNPVDLMHALHAQLISQGDEDVEDFAVAIALESERKLGRRLPKGVKVPDDGLFYRETAALGTQLARYLDVFSAEQVHVIFFEDFANDPQGEVEKVRHFLGLPPSAALIDTSVRNPSSRPRSRHLTRFLYHPPKWAIAMAKCIAPREMLVKMRDSVRRFNDVRARRVPLSAELRTELSRALEPEIELLEILTGRDLSEWRANEINRKALAPVSVVVPCFNCETTIERALDSILAQTWKPAEVIFIDDCSKDDTLSKLQVLQKQLPLGWVKVYTLDNNSGPGSARNLGWKIAAQPYIAFLDSDDTWHPKKIETQLSWMLLRPDVALTGHSYTLVSHSIDDEKITLLAKNIGFKKVAWLKMLLSNRFSTPTVIIKRELPHRFVSKKRHGEDFLLWCEICLDNYPCFWSGVPLAKLYKTAYGEGGLSGEMWAMERGELDCYTRLYQRGRISYVNQRLFHLLSILKYIKRILVITYRKFGVL